MIFLVFNLFFANYQAAAKELIRVAVIDTGVALNRNLPFCKDGHLDFTGEGDGDSHDLLHGTNVAGLISKSYNGTFCIVILKAFGSNDKGYIKALKEAYQKNYDIVNLSLSGYSYLKEEDVLIRAMLNQGQIIVAAAGNKAKNLDLGCVVFPACLDKRILVVSGKNKLRFNYGKIVDIYAPAENQEAEGIILSGTSQATAIVTGKLAAYIGKEIKLKK
jgi:subtilisin family serine protease